MKNHKKIGVAVIVNQEGEILIDKRLPTGLMANLWEFPGGKIEKGETPAECILREIKEELGVIIKVDRLLTQITHDYGEFIVTLYVHLCHLVEGKPQPLECAEVRWVKSEALDNFEFPPANQEIITIIKQHF